LRLRPPGHNGSEPGFGLKPVLKILPVRTPAFLKDGECLARDLVVARVGSEGGFAVVGEFSVHIF
jgi:hypothetical protein